MPRYAFSQLRWSEGAQRYVFSPDDQADEGALTSDWLEQSASFAFHSRSGMHYTVRKQKVQRGGSYWYAYRRLHGTLVKRYLGKTADLTLARLEEMARQLEDEADTQPYAPEGKTQQAVLSQALLPVAHPEVSSSAEELPPLLYSKLSPPGLHTFLLDRSRLFPLLDTGRECPLTILSAPAGFGKTTLVCQWMAARCALPNFPPVAWVSLEAADNDPIRFWRYLLAACQAFQVDLAGTHSALSTLNPQPPFLPSSLTGVLTALLNALAHTPGQGILVLEDYHVITLPEIHETITFFIDHLPVHIHLFLITRSDPPFALTRLRARNTLCEIRTADLRFSQEETAVLLHHSLPFPLESTTMQRLHEQLQGWGAGLHLMKLALQRTASSAEREELLVSLCRSNAPFQEYFVTEVLNLQPEPVQQFVLQTSLLPRLTASLCEVVTEQSNCQDMLALVEKANLFLEPLGAPTPHQSTARHQWYRYHALFAEAMRNEAQHRFGAEYIQRLSARASLWYEAHGLPDETIDAALDGKEYQRAANLIEQAIEERAFPEAISKPHTLQRWLEQFPDTLLEQRPVLALGYATTLLFRSESWLPDASTSRALEKLLRGAEHSFRTENNLPKLGELFAFRSLLALRQGEMKVALTYAKQALAWLPSTRQIWRGLSLSIVAEEWIEQGYFQQAQEALLEAQALCEVSKNEYFQRVAVLKLAQVFSEQGELQRASSLYRQILTSAREHAPVFALCSALVGLATLSYEWNELEQAVQYAQEALTIAQKHHLVHMEVYATLILARVLQAQGQAVVAQQQLQTIMDKVPVALPQITRMIHTAQANGALSIGDTVTVQRWASGHQPLTQFLQEKEEALLLSRWLRNQGKLAEASHLLEQLLSATRQAGSTRLMLAVQVEMVLLAVADKHKAEALQLLRDALTHALTSHMFRLFIDAGEHMAILLRTLLPQIHDQPLLTYVRTLLGAFPPQQGHGTQAQASSLLEPLSPQEQRVLRLLAQHRSNADIASELVVSVNTVRTQVQSVYNKLGVHSRSAASAVARELGLA